MGLRVEWTITCDGCQLIKKKERSPGDGVHTYYLDEWGPGIPDGWIQIPFDEVTGKHYIFFHDDECYKNWLRSQNRMVELEQFEKAIWIA